MKFKYRKFIPTDLINSYNRLLPWRYYAKNIFLNTYISKKRYYSAYFYENFSLICFAKLNLNYQNIL